jgi:lipopolysaccharide biosynthesis glycosyltransferase
MSLHIAFCHQGEHFYGLTVSIASLLSSCTASKIVIHVHSDLGSEARNKLSNLVQSRFAGTEILHYPLQLHVFDNLNLDYHKIFYYRLLLPLLHPDIDKIIYLDTDLIVEKDLKELYSLDIDNLKIAGVRDYIEQRKCEDLNINPPYINSGVMLLNLQSLRSSNFSVQCIDWLNSHCGRGLHHHDQDAINVYLQLGGLLLLDPSWNDMLPRPESFLQPKNRIIHITGPFKPWHLTCPIVYRDRFIQHYRNIGLEDEIKFLTPSNLVQAVFAANQNRLHGRFQLACELYESALLMLRSENIDINRNIEQLLEQLNELLSAGRFKFAADLGASFFQKIGYAADSFSPFQYPGILK